MGVNVACIGPGDKHFRTKRRLRPCMLPDLRGSDRESAVFWPGGGAFQRSGQTCPAAFGAAASWKLLAVWQRCCAAKAEASLTADRSTANFPLAPQRPFPYRAASAVPG